MTDTAKIENELTALYGLHKPNKYTEVYSYPFENTVGVVLNSTPDLTDTPLETSLSAWSLLKIEHHRTTDEAPAAYHLSLDILRSDVGTGGATLFAVSREEMEAVQDAAAHLLERDLAKPEPLEGDWGTEKRTAFSCVEPWTEGLAVTVRLNAHPAIAVATYENPITRFADFTVKQHREYTPDTSTPSSGSGMYRMGQYGRVLSFEVQIKVVSEMGKTEVKTGAGVSFEALTALRDAIGLILETK